MRSYLAASLALLVGFAAPSMASAADRGPALDQQDVQSPFRSLERTYFREHRLRAFEQTRAGTLQGATCVTPRGVCWIVDPLSQGEACSCPSRRFGTMQGTVGG